MQERENGCLCVRLSAGIGRRTGFLCFIILKSASFSGFGAEFFRQCVFWLPVWKSLSKSAGDLSGRSTERDPSPCIFYRTDVFDNGAERPGNGYMAFEDGFPDGFLPMHPVFCRSRTVSVDGTGHLLRWRMNREKRSAAQLLMIWSSEKGTASGLLQKDGGEHVLC